MDSNTDAHFPPYWSAMVMNAMPKIIPVLFFFYFYIIFFTGRVICVPSIQKGHFQYNEKYQRMV